MPTLPQSPRLPAESQWEIWQSILDKVPELAVQTFSAEDIQGGGLLQPIKAYANTNSLVHVDHVSREIGRKELRFNRAEFGASLAPYWDFEAEMEYHLVSGALSMTLGYSASCLIALLALCSSPRSDCGLWSISDTFNCGTADSALFFFFFSLLFFLSNCRYDPDMQCHYLIKLTSDIRSLSLFLLYDLHSDRLKEASHSCIGILALTSRHQHD